MLPILMFVMMSAFTQASPWFSCNVLGGFHSYWSEISLKKNLASCQEELNRTELMFQELFSSYQVQLLKDLDEIKKEKQEKSKYSNLWTNTLKEYEDLKEQSVEDRRMLHSQTEFINDLEKRLRTQDKVINDLEKLLQVREKEAEEHKRDFEIIFDHSKIDLALSEQQNRNYQLLLLGMFLFTLIALLCQYFFFRKSTTTTTTSPHLQQDIVYNNTKKRCQDEKIERKQKRQIEMEEYSAMLKKRKQRVPLVNDGLPAILLPRDRKNTLVLDMDNTLINTYDCAPGQQGFKKGLNWNLNIRNGAKELLEILSPLYEIVVWTSSEQSYTDEVLNYLDPCGTMIHHRRYRQHCSKIMRARNGYYLKDLTKLGRDMLNVVIIDDSPSAFLLNPKNALLSVRWEAGMDFQLLGFTNLLKDLAHEENLVRALESHTEAALVAASKFFRECG